MAFKGLIICLKDGALIGVISLDLVCLVKLNLRLNIFFTNFEIDCKYQITKENIRKKYTNYIYRQRKPIRIK